MKTKNKLTPANPTATTSTSETAWDRFWFQPSDARQLVGVRIACCALAAAWFALNLTEAGFWWGEQGWNQAQLGKKLSVSTEGIWPARFRLTPLWSTSAYMATALWSVTGIGLSVAAAWGWGGRWARAGVFLLSLFLAQRLAWAAGLFEPYLIALLGYLMIGPSASLQSFLAARNSSNTEQASTVQMTWLSTFSLRLIQMHTFILLCFTLAALLSADVWWRGEAVWFLAASGHSLLLNSEALLQRELIVNLLSHGIAIATALSVGWLWWAGRWRWVGLIAGWLVAFSLALFADQVLYGLLLSVGIAAFRFPASLSAPDA